MANFQPNGFSPPESVFAPLAASKPSESPAPPQVRTLVMDGGDEPVVVRGVVSESESGWSVELSHEYEGVPFAGLTFEADGKLFEVVERVGRMLTLEVA